MVLIISQHKEIMKTLLNAFIAFELLVLILMSLYLIIYPGIKEVVWLVPNDESCSDIFLSDNFEGVIGNYELKPTE